jgi:2,3-bisphosphoglycerate-dependent phosphoglycerate mutase
MSLAAWVGDKRFEIGSSPFLKAWFSTIFVRLESGRWGSLFPAIMNDFYAGRLASAKAPQALKELQEIRTRLSRLPPEQVVWDFENLQARPPWGSQISPHITSLGNYFVTSDGDDLIEALADALEEAIRDGHDVAIR